MPIHSIGIDLGTTFSGAAYFDDGLAQMIPDDNGAVLIPSLFAFNNKQILVGDEVRYQMAFNPENSIYEVKRLMGKNMDDKSIQEDLKVWPFKLIEDNKQIKFKLQFDGKEIFLTPEEISSHILKKLKATSEKYLNSKIKDVVISVPAHFNNKQKAATKSAGAIAGLNVIKMISEPTAAALAYGFGRNEKDKTSQNILVYDLGGGTFDVSIVNICGREFKVLAIEGDSHLGGEDFTNRMVTHLLKEFEKKHNITLMSVNSLMRTRLRESCEKAKRRLSAVDCKLAYIELDHFYIASNGDRLDYYTQITKEVFESINQDLFKRTLELVNKCIESAKLTESDIHEVVLVGGSTRVPMIQNMLEDLFSPHKVNRSVDPDTAVALGAAVEAAILSGDKTETIQNTKLFDIIPLSLGVGYDTKFENMSFLIKKNSLIPNKVVSRFVTSHDNQTGARFPIYEGEREFTKDNFYLGEFSIYSIPKGPAGSVGVDVTFDIDLNGILRAEAVETSMGKTAKITIKNLLERLTAEEVREMIRKSEEFKEIDLANKKKVTKQRELERYSYDIRNYLAMEETQDKISARVYNTCRTKNDDVLLFLSTTNSSDTSIDDFRKQLEDIKSVCHAALNNLFKEDKGRGIGEMASIKDESHSAQNNKPKTLYEVD